MANQITVANLPTKNFVDVTSRYTNSQVFYYGKTNVLTFETYKRKPIVTSPDDKFMVIPKGAEYRPDLVAFNVYGVPSLWWQLLQANNMMDIWEFKSGTNIRIPNSFFAR